MSSSSMKKIILKSADGETFEVDEAVAMESLTIKHSIEDGCTNDMIPIPNVIGNVLAKVIEYCKMHVESRGGSEDGAKADEEAKLKAWDADFIKLNQSALFDLMLAANYLNIKDLLDMTCQATADMVKDMSVEDCRKFFNIENDFSPEEEEVVRRENQWAFE